MIELLLPGWLARDDAGLAPLVRWALCGLAPHVLFRRHAGACVSARRVAFGLLPNVNPFYAVIAVTLLLAGGLVWLEKRPHLAIDTLLGIMATARCPRGWWWSVWMSNVRRRSDGVPASAICWRLRRRT